MAKRLFFAGGLTFNAQAYTTGLTASTYMGVQGGSGTQQIDVLEILINGMATASIVSGFQLVRASTVAVTPTALASPNSDGPTNPATAALGAPVATFVTAGTQPQASAVTTDAKLNLGMNAFGGIIRWNASPTQQFTILGNTADFGCALLFNSSTSGGSNAAANAHIMYEPY
jgi:hypothetical protein